MRASSSWQGLATACLLASALYGCGSGSSNPSNGGVIPTTTLSGTAATGAAIAGGSIAVKCGSSFSGTATTDSDGGWELANVPTASLPCAVQVSFAGQTLHAMTVTAGGAVTVNITPLTDLVIASASGQSPATWFAGSTWASIAGQLEDAQEDIRQALNGLGVSLPESMNPFSTAFTATSGNSYDDALEALKSATADNGLGHSDLVNIIRGGTLPDELLESGGTVTYNSITHTRGGYAYRTETGSYSLVAGTLSGSWGFLQVRVGNEAPASGSLDVAALTPGVGTEGPIAAGKVQLYTWGLDGGMAWTDASSAGQVSISVDGDTVTATGNDITLNNGKTISFNFSADKPSACNNTGGDNKLVLRGHAGLCELARTSSNMTSSGSELQFRISEALNKYIDIKVVDGNVTQAALRDNDGTTFNCGNQASNACSNISYSFAGGTDSFVFNDAALGTLTVNGTLNHVRPPTVSTINSQGVALAMPGGSDAFTITANIDISDADASLRKITVPGTYGYSYQIGACEISEAGKTSDDILHWGRWNNWSNGCKKTDATFSKVFSHYSYGTLSPAIPSSAMPAADAWAASYNAIAATTPGRSTQTPADNNAVTLPDLSKIKVKLSKQAGSTAVIPDIDFYAAITGHDVVLEDSPAALTGVQDGSNALPSSFRRFPTLRLSNGNNCPGNVRCGLVINITFYGPNQEYATLAYSLSYIRSDYDTAQPPDVRDLGIVILQKQ